MSNTPETKSFYVTAFDVEEWAEKCIRLEKERDDALSQIAQAECRAERFCQERDEAREKYATEATEHMLAINEICNERDEARDAILGWENKWRCAVDMAARAEMERDDALNKLNDLKNILR
jgi:hypothetical protein